MKAVSLLQPWASLVALGHKRVETRSWPTPHRGLVAIHASKGFRGDCRAFAVEEWELGRLPEAGARLPRGAIIAVAQLVAVSRTEQISPRLSELERRLGNYDQGRFAWELTGVLALATPVPCAGSLGLWTVPAGIAETVASGRLLG